MRVSGKPRLPRSRRSPKSTSVVCISHTSAFRNFLIPSLRLGISKTLWPIFMGCPFPGLWHHCLLAWYYGGSVAMRLATFRRSRFCVSETLSVFRCLFCSLSGSLPATRRRERSIHGSPLMGVAHLPIPNAFSSVAIFDME